MSDAKQPFWVRCGACQHTWAAAYLPMEAQVFAKVARASCPMCGGGARNVFIAKQKDGVLLEPAGANPGEGA